MIWLILVEFVIVLSLAVGLIDYLLFQKLSRCPHCDKEINAPIWSWIPATIIELALFVLGFVIGFVMWRIL